jgi:hypothetical protein
MHATADARAVKFSHRLGRRVMPGVRLLGRPENSAGWTRSRGGCRGREVEAVPAVVDGLTSWVVAAGRHGGAPVLLVTARAAWRALKVTPSNKRMHATRDTLLVMLRGRCGRARDARRWAASHSVAVIGLPRGEDDDFHS